MYKINLIVLASLIFIIGCTEGKHNEQVKVTYPKTKKVDTIDTYFGNKIPDPYRWLEDDKSPETAAWVKGENELTYNYLGKIPFRDKIKERLTKIWNFTRYSPPYKKNNYYFFTKNDGIQNQSVLYIQEGLNGTPKVLLDPNTLASDGTASLGATAVSKDGKYLAYTINKAGSDWSEIYVMETAGKKLNDEIKYVKFSDIAWKGNGFYYSAYAAPTGKSELSNKNEFHKVYYHKIGEPQNNDVLVFEDKKHGLRNFAADVTEDEKILIVYGSESTSGTSLMVKDLTKPNAPFTVIVDNFDNNYSVIHNDGNKLMIISDKDASRYQLLQIDITDDPANMSWKKIIPEADDLLESVSICKNKIIVKYLKNVASRLYVYDMEGKLEHEIKLPGLCKIDGFSGDKDDSLCFFSYNTFTAPATIYKYNVTTNQMQVWNKPTIDFNSDDYMTKQVFYKSKDGVKVPMFITFKKDTKLNGKNPCFLFGYGGFNSYYSPEFRIDRAVFLEHGGVYAIPGIRGGGEYGEQWHKDGTKCKKQKVFDDFIAAAQYLIDNKYTCSDKLAINGRSNGGLLIGAVITQRPDLCKVAIPTVGVMDMLRYHKFTIGWAWASDYGTSDNKDEYECLIKYSPLHNIKPAEYPATLITTGDHDDRVVPAHSFKFASTMQENQKGSNPILIRVDVNAGHGAGKPTAKQIDEAADIWSFVFYNLGIEI